MGRCAPGDRKDLKEVTRPALPLYEEGRLCLEEKACERGVWGRGVVVGLRRTYGRYCLRSLHSNLYA
jgi:hypothetical protein